MLFSIPIVHGGKHGFALMNGEHGAFGKHFEVFVGYDCRYLDNEIRVRLQAGHL